MTSETPNPVVLSAVLERQTVKQPVQLYRMSTSEHECPWGLKAVALLKDKGIDFEDHKLATQEETEAFKAAHQVTTTPQVFFGGERIGGYTDLAAWFDVEAKGIVLLFSAATANTTKLQEQEIVVHHHSSVFRSDRLL